VRRRAKLGRFLNHRPKNIPERNPILSVRLDRRATRPGVLHDNPLFCEATMKWNRENARRRRDCVQILAGLTLALMLFATAAQAQSAEANPSAETYKTFYLTNLTQ
jgi:hypothetical protein